MQQSSTHQLPHKPANIYQAWLYRAAYQLRRRLIASLGSAGSGHAAGPLGCAEVMAVLYLGMLRHRPEQLDWPERDIFVMSNGHYAPLLYAAMAERGLIDPSELATLRRHGSRLQGHPERCVLPGLETTSGPLGSGLSQAAGMAYCRQYLAPAGHEVGQVYCLLGDGELDEGNVWEAAMFAAKYRLQRLVAIVDRNQIQIGGSTEQVMPLGKLAEKWRSFGWQTRLVNGHAVADLVQTLRATLSADNHQPQVIIAQTIPGYGVDFMRGDHSWHGRAPNEKQPNRRINNYRKHSSC